MHHKELHIESLNPTSVEILTQASNPTQVESVCEETELLALSRTALVQDSSVELESRALPGLERGYTRLPNQVLMQLASGNLTRNEIRIVLLIARYTISFRRDAAPLSKRVLERQSGLRGAAVLEAISGLVAKGIVHKTQGDQNRPNFLGLVLPENWDVVGTRDTPQLVKATTQVLPFTERTCSSNLDQARVVKPTTGWAPILTPIKDIKIYKTKNSPADVPENLKEYFAGLKPTRKHESELRAFQSLRKEYEPGDIAECVRLLLERGARAGKSGYQPCHSPMAYLSKAIEEVIRDVHRLRNTAILSARRHTDQKVLEAEASFHRELSAREFSAKETAFQAEFPTVELQCQKIDELCKHVPFDPAPQVQRIYAIHKWFELNTASTSSSPVSIESAIKMEGPGHCRGAK